MSERLRRHLSTIRRLRRMNASERRNFIRRCEPDFIDCLSECCKSVIKGNVTLNSNQLKRLRRYRQSLRQVSKKKTSRTTRRKLLQSGGFLPLLLGPLLGLASSLVAGAINRNLDKNRQ
jgi:hypothetical protein